MSCTLHLACFSPYNALVAFCISERRSRLITLGTPDPAAELSDISCGRFDSLQKKKKSKTLRHKTSPYSQKKGAQFLRCWRAFSPLPSRRIKSSLFCSKSLSQCFIFSASVEIKVKIFGIKKTAHPDLANSKNVSVRSTQGSPSTVSSLSRVNG